MMMKPSRFRTRLLVLAAFGLALSGGPAGAQISQITNSPLTLASYTNPVTFAQWDGPPGDLQSVSILLMASLLGTNQVENLSFQINDITINFQSSFELRGPDNGLLLALNVATQRLLTLTPFDGVVDFLPTSGLTFSDLAASGSTSIILTDPTDLAPFIGSSSVVLSLGAADLSSSSDTKGNHLYNRTQYSGATLELIYTVIPEPGTLVMSLCGLALAWGLRRAAWRRSRTR